MSKTIIPLIVVTISNAIGFTISYFFLSIVQEINIEAYGSSICEFSGTILGFLIASLTIALGINGNHINKFKKYGYFKALILFYLIMFIELILTFFSGIMCFINPIITNTLYISIALTISSLICVFLAFIQIINLSIKK
ncbi:hypothetical protein J3U66_04465 [Gilliamella sp. B2969]|uniref:hypothetical protein n=1 Tax=Gilliamella sp. B2969 TaxID=2818021 RepID=UPI00226AB2F8|nr:hypothetical protein [Gilliamella sp. B2969]MCX8729627.1 hypothetical protein [Gilliamella sp. B2969]